MLKQTCLITLIPTGSQTVKAQTPVLSVDARLQNGVGLYSGNDVTASYSNKNILFDSSSMPATGGGVSIQTRLLINNLNIIKNKKS